MLTINRSRAGFTLIELLVVIAIIAILASIL
ncbi:MAG TPA: prepilin-type N-terminal cleavage/methylation domain-containing protein, partial [Armatimonadota bacterium]|nr:prepilin-type N-terminal cleavage/methylation domain-containing protein [Armatimonadota bacterium]